jgi:hypothetical protein
MRFDTREVPLTSLEQTIRKKLNDIVRRNDDVRKLNRTEWTKGVKQALGEIGRYRSLAVTVHGWEGATDRQWLFDMTWAKEWGKGKEFLRSLILAMECEWNRTDEELDWDFQKLLVVRADLRLFVFNQKDKDAIEEKMARFKKQISGYRDTQDGDRYLLAGISNDASVFLVRALLAECRN